MSSRIHKEVKNLIVWTSKHTHTTFTWMSWFRNGILQFSLLPIQAMHCLHSSPSTSPSPAVGWRGQWETQKVKIMGWDNNNLLERAMRWEKKTDDSGSRKEILLLTMETPSNRQYLTAPSVMLLPLLPPAWKWNYPTAASTLTPLEGIPCPQSRLHSSHSDSDMMWYRTTSMSQSWLLTTAKVISVLAWTRTMTK